MALPKPTVRWLRLEAAVALVFAIGLYSHSGMSWWLFALLLFVPDIFMLGYLKNTSIGAFVYNCGHSYIAPAMLWLIGLITANQLSKGIAFIWVAHIAFDRLLGYGLKANTSFNDTHLGTIGKKK